MNMIRRAADDQHRALNAIQSAADVAKNLSAIIILQQRFAIPRGEDDVQQNVAEGLRHAISPLWGFGLGGSRPRALRYAHALGYGYYGPLGLGFSSDWFIR
jgi:hypothetical protein